MLFFNIDKINMKGERKMKKSGHEAAKEMLESKGINKETLKDVSKETINMLKNSIIMQAKSFGEIMFADLMIAEIDKMMD